MSQKWGCETKRRVPRSKGQKPAKASPLGGVRVNLGRCYVCSNCVSWCERSDQIKKKDGLACQEPGGIKKVRGRNLCRPFLQGLIGMVLEKR